MKNNIIFLDVDGVLNSTTFHMSLDRNNLKNMSHRERHIDPNAVKLLDKLCQETNSLIVLSSSWRIGGGGERLISYLNELNFKSKIIDETGRCCSGIRGVEIYNWWNKNKDEYNNYVIVDDDSDMLLWQQYHFFQTDPYVGITPTTSYKIKRFLNKED